MKIKYLPIITRIVSKINISECFQKIKEIDFSEGASLNNLSQDDLGKIGMVLLEVIVSKCNEIENDLELLIAAYENKKVEDIQELDLIDELKKIFSDEGIRKSFSFALKK